MEREVWRGGCGERGVERGMWREGCGEGVWGMWRGVCEEKSVEREALHSTINLS